MKTKIFSVLVALGITILGVSDVFAKAAVDQSSGIKTQSYLLEWCSPHATELYPNGVTKDTCREGSFQMDGGVATIKYDGTNFPGGSILPETNLANLIPTTRTNLTITNATPALVGFFSGVTGGAFSLEGEGVLSIRVYLEDYAQNMSYYVVRYKIDKTGPQLSFTKITENNDTTYYAPVDADTRVLKDLPVDKNDSSITTSLGDAFADPSIGSYSSATTAMPRSGHVRNNLHAFYFKNQLASEPFTINTEYSDSYEKTNFLIRSAISPSDGYTSELTSGIKGFHLATASGLVITPAITPTADFTTSNLSTNNFNTQQTYRLRLYDNSVTATGDTGNYSETAFYAVRDNTAPNHGGNNLAGTDDNLAAEMLLAFNDSNTVYDKTANGVSRFFAAEKNVPLAYKFNDIGITGNGTTAGSGCDGATGPLTANYAGLCNAGINVDSGNKPVIKIESHTAPGTFDQLVNFPSRFVNVGTDTDTDFSKVDNHMDWTGTNYTYGKYGVRYYSNPNGLGQDQLCDNVNNCFKPELSFRVVAGDVSKDQSKLAISSLNETDGKMIANGKSAYKLSYDLKDAYANKVVPVVSKENSGTPQIKAVTSTLTFNNGLNVNQLKNSGGTGDKFVGVANLNPSPKMSVFSSTINTGGTVSMTENIPTASTTPAGNYAISLNSPVPTQGAYPYLSDKSVLSVKEISNDTDNILASGAITYPSTGTRMGYGVFAVSAGNDPATSLTVVDRGGIGEVGGLQNITLTGANYGKVTYPDAGGVAFSTLPNRFANFEFASPYVYGLTDMRIMVDGFYGNHYKKLYSIEQDPTFSNYNVFERHLVAMSGTKDEQPKLMDFKTRTGPAATEYDISKGVRYTQYGDIRGDFLFASDNSGSMVDTQTFHVPFDIIGAALTPDNAFTGSGFRAEVQMSTKPGFVYDKANLKTGFVSALTYSSPADPAIEVRLPSVARNLQKIAGGTTSAASQYEMARNYFDGPTSYALGTPLGFPTDNPPVTVNDIAIIGLSNRLNSITTDTTGNKKNVNVEGELNRTTLIANIKQNVASVSRGFGAAGAQKQWFVPTAPITGFDGFTGTDANTINVNGELITFVEGNTTIECNGGADGNTCLVTGRRSFIVKNGSLYIKSNISTLDSNGSQTAGQLFLGVMNDTGLANVDASFNPKDVNIQSADMSGWMFVDPAVTNIDAFLFAQWPMVSYNDADKSAAANGKNVFYTKDIAKVGHLSNQLYINGSILTLNTITGSRKEPLRECPYIVDDCTESLSQIFDLVYTRSFTLKPKSTMSQIETDTDLVPYYETPPGFPSTTTPWEKAKKAGGLTGTMTIADPSYDKRLRSITDPTYQPYPIIIERDLRWNSAPSRLFQVNR